MNKKAKEFYSTEAVLIERENEVLAELATEYRLRDLGPTDTEPHMLARIKAEFTIYSRMRSQGRCKADLLKKLHTQICKYRVLVPEFYGGPLLCFAEFKKARAALREPNAPVRKNRDQALVPATMRQPARVGNFTLRVADDVSSPVDLNQLVKSLATNRPSGEACVIVVVVNP